MGETKTKTARHVEILGLVLIFLQAIFTFVQFVYRYHAFLLGDQFTLYFQAFTYFATGHFGYGPTYGGTEF